MLQFFWSPRIRSVKQLLARTKILVNGEPGRDLDAVKPRLETPDSGL